MRNALDKEDQAVMTEGKAPGYEPGLKLETGEDPKSEHGGEKNQSRLEAAKKLALARAR